MPTPYNDDLFRGLAADGRFFLKVVFVMRASAGHPWQDSLGEGYRWSTLLNWRSELTLYRDILNREFDAFIFAGWGTRQYMVATALAALMGVPYFLFTDTPKVRRGRNFIFERLRRLWLTYALKHSSGLLATGKLACDRMKSLGYTMAPIFSLPYALDEQRFPVGPSQANSTQIKLISSGRLINDLKGFDIGIRALARVLHRSVPHSDISYTIVGSGPDRNALQQLIESLGLGQHVFLVPWLSQQDLSNAYRSSTIYLHPARFEPYGMTVVEALYSGLYAICSADTGAAIELIQNGRNGIICPSGDDIAFATAIEAGIEGIVSARISKPDVRAASLKWPLSKCIDTVFDIVSMIDTAPPAEDHRM